MYERFFECFIDMRLRQGQDDHWELTFTSVVEDLETQPFTLCYLATEGGMPGTTCLAVEFNDIS